LVIVFVLSFTIKSILQNPYQPVACSCVVFFDYDCTTAQEYITSLVRIDLDNFIVPQNFLQNISSTLGKG
jgi:hypothetical protein